MSVSIDENNVVVTVSQDIKTQNLDINGYPNTITVKSNEYTIVGDGLFATTKEEVPEWMQSLVNDLARSATTGAYNAMVGFNYNLYNALTALQVAENKYQQAINTRITDQEAFVQAVDTLNSTVQNSESEIVNIKQTYATKDFAVATVAETLEASINGGAIKSSLGSLASSMTNQYGTMAQRMDVLESTFENLELGVEGYANATNTLETYVGVTEGVPDGTGLLGRVDILEKQNDGVIETVSGTYDVMLNPQDPNLAELVLTAEPYVSWATLEEKLAHIGDVYIKYNQLANGTKEYVASYKFIKTVPDTTTPYSTDADGFTWAVIIDQAAQDAYQQAVNAYDLADNKRRVFVTTPVPPYDVGDLWSVQAGATIIGSTQGGRVIQVGDLLRCAETKLVVGAYEHNDWVPADSYREGINAIASELDGFIGTTYAGFVTNIQGQVDSKAESYYQETAPHLEGTNTEYAKWVGDLWKVPSNNNEYIYSLVGTEYKWVKTDVPDIVYDTIDTKKSIYTGNTVPVDSGVDIVQVNDTWITGDTPVSPYKAKTLYIYNGSGWVEPLRYTDDTAVTTLATGLANGTVEVDLGNAYIDGVLLETHLQQELDNLVAVYSGTDHTTQVGMEDGDIYIESTTETSASGVTVDVVNTYKYNGTSWVQINSNDNLTALADLADGKRSIFSGNTIPVGALDRDIWIPSADSGSYKQGEVYQYLGTNWVLTTRYSKLVSDILDGTTAIGSAKIGDQTLAEYIADPTKTGTDKMVNVYSGDETEKPTLGTGDAGDLYVETKSTTPFTVTTYRWNGTAWVEIEGDSNVTKLKDLTDGKRTIFTTVNVPADTDAAGGLSVQPGDLWIPPATVGNYRGNEIYICTSTNPILFSVATDYYYLIDNVKQQIDGKVDTYYQATVPYSDQEDVARDVRAGDYWYCTNTAGVYTKGLVYKYVEAANGSNYDYTWTETADVTKSVFDLADGKATVFSNAGTDVPEGEANDLWVPSTSSTDGITYVAKELYKHNGTDWVLATKYTDDTAVTYILNGTTKLNPNVVSIGDKTIAEYVTGEVDAQVVVYSGTNHIEQTTAKLNDLYIESTTVAGSSSGVTVDVTNTYRHDGTTWVQINSNDNLTAFADLVDGKRTVFSGGTEPVAAEDGDLWIPSANVNETVVGGVTVADFYKGEIYQYEVDTWKATTRYSEDLQGFVNNTYTPKVTTLQEQVDGKVESWYTVATSDPKVGWTTQGVRDLHDGDLWYQTDTKTSYYYDATTHSWLVLEDATAIQALQAAGTAQATADGVVVSYYAIEQGTAPDISKLWLDNSGTKVLKKYSTSWVNVVVKEGDTLTAFSPVDNDTRVYVYRGSGWVTETPSGIVASSKAVTDLELDLISLDNSIYGASGLQQTLEGAITTEGSRVESKFAYNSNLTLNGVPYSSGFGLATSINDSTIPTGSSEFWISADKFKMTTTGYNGTKYSPFTVSGVDGSITFNGKVVFGNNQSGTIDEAIQASIESVVVGDKNINITDNLIPPDVMVTDVDNAGYQFIGDPVKALVAGIDTFSEVQVTLDGDVGAVDEVYSPYVDEVVFPYYYRFGVKGISSLSGVFYITLIDDLDQITYQSVTVNLEPGKTISSASWYIVDGIINPTGSGAGTSGRILTPGLEKIATIDNFTLPAGTAKILLGWVGPCTISRMKLAKITADTFTGTVATVDYVEGQGYVDASYVTSQGYVAGSDIYAAGTTEIDGGRIKTGSITAEQINVDTAFVNELNATGGIKASKIDVNNGNGFILNSEVVGSSSTPNIQGGYIKGGVVDGTSITSATLNSAVITGGSITLSTGYPGCFASTVISTANSGGSSADSPTFLPRNTSGTNSLTMANTSQVFSITGIGTVDRYAGGTTTITISVSVNGGAWSTVTSKNFGYSPAGTIGTLYTHTNTLLPVQFRISVGASGASTLSTSISVTSYNL